MEEIIKFGPLTERPDEERIEVKITTPSDLELDTYDVNFPTDPDGEIAVEITCHLKKITPQSEDGHEFSFIVTPPSSAVGDLQYTVLVQDGSNVETSLVAKKKWKNRIIYLDHVILTHTY